MLRTNPETTIDSLSPEVLLHVFSFLNQEDLRRASEVSGRFNAIAQVPSLNPELFILQKNILKTYAVKARSGLGFLIDSNLNFRKEYINRVLNFLYSHRDDWKASVNFLQGRILNVKPKYSNAALLISTLQKLQATILHDVIEQGRGHEIISYFSDLTTVTPAKPRNLAWELMLGLASSSKFGTALYGLEYFITAVEQGRTDLDLFGMLNFLKELKRILDRNILKYQNNETIMPRLQELYDREKLVYRAYRAVWNARFNPPVPTAGAGVL